jgi:hypothetical protein
VPAVGLGAEQRGVGIGDESINIGGILRVDHAADAEPHGDQLAAHLEGLCHGIEQALGQSLMNQMAAALPKLPRSGAKVGAKHRGEVVSERLRTKHAEPNHRESDEIHSRHGGGGEHGARQVAVRINRLADVAVGRLDWFCPRRSIGYYGLREVSIGFAGSPSFPFAARRRSTARQGIVAALIQAADAAAIESPLLNLEIGAHQGLRRKLFNGKANGF